MFCEAAERHKRQKVESRFLADSTDIYSSDSETGTRAARQIFIAVGES